VILLQFLTRFWVSLITYDSSTPEIKIVFWCERREPAGQQLGYMPDCSQAVALAAGQGFPQQDQEVLSRMPLVNAVIACFIKNFFLILSSHLPLGLPAGLFQFANWSSVHVSYLCLARTYRAPWYGMIYLLTGIG